MENINKFEVTTDKYLKRLQKQKNDEIAGRDSIVDCIICGKKYSKKNRPTHEKSNKHNVMLTKKKSVIMQSFLI